MSMVASNRSSSGSVSRIWMSSCVLSIVAKQKQQRKHPRTPGPKPEVLKIKGDCRDAIKKSLEKKKPTSDWAK